MFYDSLTGLPNAILFIDRLQQALAHAARRSQQVALVYLDVDHFGQLIKTHGTVAGDVVLREMASRLKSCVSRQEDTVARLCGDQFVLILGDIDGVNGTRKILDKVFAAMQQKFCLEEVDTSVSLSIGASLFPHDGKEWSELLRCASMSMRQAKTAGGNRYFCQGDGNKERKKEAKEARKRDEVVLPSGLLGNFWVTSERVPMDALVAASWKH